jgi:hypothetical protein
MIISSCKAWHSKQSVNNGGLQHISGDAFTCKLPAWLLLAGQTPSLQQESKGSEAPIAKLPIAKLPITKLPVQNAPVTKL